MCLCLLFVALYGLLAVYFSCVMIRLMLVVAPAACVLASIGISYLIRKMAKAIRNGMQNDGEDDEAESTPLFMLCYEERWVTMFPREVRNPLAKNPRRSPSLARSPPRLLFF